MNHSELKALAEKIIANSKKAIGSNQSIIEYIMAAPQLAQGFLDLLEENQKLKECIDRIDNEVHDSHACNLISELRKALEKINAKT